MADRNDAVTMSLEEAKILVMRGMAGQSPRINPTNNHWEVYDNESGSWKDTGVDASGNIDITGDNQLVFLNYDGDTTRITVAETGEFITAAQIGALTTQGKMSFLYVDTDSPEWLAFNGWFPNSGEAVFDNDRLHAVVTTNLQTLVTTGLVTVKPMLPSVTTEDAGKVLKVSNSGVWSKGDAPSELPSLDPDGADANKLLGVDEQGEEYKLVARPEGVPSYESANVGSVLKLYRPSANSGNAMTWGSPVYQIPVTKIGNTYTIASGITAEDIVANRGNLAIVLNGNTLYNCVGALTSGFIFGHFYFVAAKPTDSAIETEWLDLSFFTGANSSVSVTPFSFDIEGLPAVTSSDAWKVLTVNGQGVWTPLPYPEKVIYLRHYVNAADGIQAHTILQYANGAWVTANGAAIAEMIEEGGVYPIISDYNGTSFPLFYKLEQVLVNMQLVFRATQPNGTATVLVLPWASSIASTFDVVADLPAVTAEDNGKVLKVVNGVWAAVSE